MKAPLKIPHRPSEGGPPSRQPPAIDPLRFIPFYLFIALATVGLIARLIYLQVAQGEEYDALARENRESKINIPSPRGIITDRNGVLLARNVPSYNITLTPAYLPDDDISLQELYQYLSKLTGAPINTPPLDANARCGVGDAPPCGIADLVTANEGFPYNPIPIAKDVPPEVAFIIREQLRSHPGVGVEVAPLREYPTGALTAHIVGYMGPITEQVKDYYEGLGFLAARDRIGYSGIEAWMQDVLAGQNGYKYIEEDAAGLELRTIGEPVNPVPGNNVQLTIDVRLQQAAQAILTKRINDINLYSNTTVSQNGVVIAMNPRTGEILALVSWPTYDNQRFARFIPGDYFEQLSKDSAKPLLNQAISGQHPPGSVFKIVTAAGALQENVVDPLRTLFDPGQIIITNRYFPNDPGQSRPVVCWKKTGHGDIDMVNAIAQSCSVYFYKIGGGYAPDNVEGIDIEGLFKYGVMFGYHRRTGLELPGELKGLIPDRDYKRINIGENWSTGDTYIAAIGQGYVLATPMQVLDSVTPFLNNGWLIKPTLIKEVTDGEGNVVPVAQSYATDTYRDFVPLGTPNSYQLSPFAIKYRDGDPNTPDVLDPTSVSQYNLDIVRRGMEEVYISGTAYIAREQVDIPPLEVEIGPDQVLQIQAGGKSGTAEYCDNVAQRKQICKFGAWPRHAWFIGYAPAANPEIAVVAFVYNGGEGSLTSGPIVQSVLQAYFDLKAGDATRDQ
jgi:penicillin-binding protein 2